MALVTLNIPFNFKHFFRKKKDILKISPLAKTQFQCFFKVFIKATWILVDVVIKLFLKIIFFEPKILLNCYLLNIPKFFCKMYLRALEIFYILHDRYSSKCFKTVENVISSIINLILTMKFNTFFGQDELDLVQI